MTRPRRFGRSPARSSTTGRQSPPSSPTPICPPPTTRPSAPCVTPSSPGGSPTATRTEEGSAAYAATLSVLETCRRRGVEPWRYITDLLDRPAGPGPQRSAAPHHPAFSMTGGGERVRRYSLDEPGLIYANSGNVGFDPIRYHRFPADADAIIPLSDESWFPDDATARFVQFVGTVWPAEGLADNLALRRRNPRSQAGRAARRYDPPLLHDPVLQGPPPDLQAPADLLAVLQRQAQGVRVPCLPAPLHRRHAGAHADRLCHPAPGQHIRHD